MNEVLVLRLPTLRAACTPLRLVATCRLRRTSPRGVDARARPLPASECATATMVRSLSQWTKTLSFPARLSPNRTSKESVVNVQPGSPGVSPTPSASSLPQGSEKTITPIPITEISQIVSLAFYFKLQFREMWHPNV